MRRRVSRLLFILALATTALGGLFTPKAQASCTRHCTLIDCGTECCTYSDCTTVCVHVACGN